MNFQEWMLANRLKSEIHTYPNGRVTYGIKDCELALPQGTEVCGTSRRWRDEKDEREALKRAQGAFVDVIKGETVVVHLEEEEKKTIVVPVSLVLDEEE